MSNSNIKTIATIPCFNEERTIGSIVLLTKKYVDQVIIIDDGSIDDSVGIARSAGARVHEHIYNQGYGQALKTALHLCRTEQADIQIILDGDGQHDPADIPRFISAAQNKDIDLVLGTRFLDGNSETPLYRKIGQKVITILSTLAFGSHITDNQCGFRALKKRAIHSICLGSSGMGASVDFHREIAIHHLRYIEIPVKVRYQ